MSLGTVKWFDGKKGYGFIEQDGTEESIFVHFKAIESEGFKSLNIGQRVECEVEDGPKGPRATKVKVIQKEDGNVKE